MISSEIHRHISSDRIVCIKIITKKDVKLAANRRLTPVLITIIDRVPRNCAGSNPRPIMSL